MAKLVSEREFSLLLVSGSATRYGLSLIPDDPGYVHLLLVTDSDSFLLATRRGLARRWRADTGLRWLSEHGPEANPVFFAELIP